MIRGSTVNRLYAELDEKDEREKKWYVNSQPADVQAPKKNCERKK